MALYKNITKTALAFSLNPQGDYLVNPGDTVELPEQNRYVRSLVAKRYLTEIDPPRAPKKSINRKPIKPKKR